jgi:DNA-binding NarL/FixJ family response regulator
MSSYRIVLADDHTLFREGLKRILKEMIDLEVIGEAGSGLDLLKILRELNPEMVILDISMPNLRGLEAIQEIRAIRPNVKILILTMHDNREYLIQSISAGANGYLLKDDAHKELFSAIGRIREGKKYISSRFSNNITEEDWIRNPKGNIPPSESELLTLREREVLKLIAEGKTSKEIADLLFISPRTAERHRANIMEKLNMKKSADLIRYAIQKGYL